MTIETDTMDVKRLFRSALMKVNWLFLRRFEREKEYENFKTELSEVFLT